MMGLLMPGGEANFDPPLTSTQKEKYAKLTTKLVKVAGAACFPFSARERLQDRMATQLEKLVEQTGDAFSAEESAKVVRSLVANVIRDPYATKFRTVKLSNAVVQAKVVKFPAAMAMLRGVGFASGSGDGNVLTLGAGKKVVNVAPLWRWPAMRLTNGFKRVATRLPWPREKKGRRG